MLVRARAQLEQIPGIRVMSSATDNLEAVSYTHLAGGRA